MGVLFLGASRRHDAVIVPFPCFPYQQCDISPNCLTLMFLGKAAVEKCQLCQVEEKMCILTWVDRLASGAHALSVGSEAPHRFLTARPSVSPLPTPNPSVWLRFLLVALLLLFQAFRFL